MINELNQMDDEALYQHVIDQIFELVDGEGRGNAFQQAVVGQHIATGLIGNRGLSDHPSEDIDRWIRAYEVLGFDEIARVLRKAKPILGAFDEKTEDTDPELEALEEAFYELDEQVRSSMGSLIRKNLDTALQQ